MGNKPQLTESRRTNQRRLKKCGGARPKPRRRSTEENSAAVSSGPQNRNSKAKTASTGAVSAVMNWPCVKSVTAQEWLGLPASWWKYSCSTGLAAIAVVSKTEASSKPAIADLAIRRTLEFFCCGCTLSIISHVFLTDASVKMELISLSYHKATQINKRLPFPKAAWHFPNLILRMR